MEQQAQPRYPALRYQVTVLSTDQLLEVLNNHSVARGIGFFELALLEELKFQTEPIVDRGVELVFHPRFSRVNAAVKLGASDRTAAMPG